MKKKLKILVLFDGVDTTTNALREAAELAGSGTVIELVGIVNPRWTLYRVAFASGSGLQPEQIHREELCQLNQALIEVARTAPDAVELQIITKLGRPSRVEAELRRDGGYDLMMLPSSASSSSPGARCWWRRRRHV